MLNEVHFPVYRTETGLEHTITTNGVAIPGVLIEEKSGGWKLIQEAVKMFMREHLGDDFSGEVTVDYATPGVREKTNGIMCYATPNGTAGFNVHVHLANTIH